jgi:uncharacterized phiE125 gp8 family phage protein
MIALSTIKAALKVDYSTDDADLLRLRDAVVALVETHTGLTICPKTVTQYLGGFARARLEHAPFISVDSVKYTSTAGTTVTMPSTDYFLVRKELPTVYLDFTKQPTAKEGTEIEVNLSVGYSKVPADLEHAIIALIGTLYENPGSIQTISGGGPLPMGAEFILSNLRVRGSVS